MKNRPHFLRLSSYPEEIQDQKRFLHVSPKNIWSIRKKAIEKWVEYILKIVAQDYDEAFMLRAKSRLDQAMTQPNSVESVTTVLINLEEEGLDDNYFSSWLVFVEKEEISNIRSWLLSQGIDLVSRSSYD